MTTHSDKEGKKRYRLKKDLPVTKAGAIFVYNEENDFYEIDGAKPITTKTGNIFFGYPTCVVELSDWFEPIEEVKGKERIEVTKISYTHIDDYDSKEAWIKATLSRHPDANKLRLIKEAIEFTLNNDPDEVKIGDHTFKFQSGPLEKTYTQEQLNQAIQEAFHAARVVVGTNMGTPLGKLEQKVFEWFNTLTMFPDLSDYLSSLKQ
jgi:hypothetical protein